MLPYHSKITKYIFLLFILFIFVYALFEARNIISGPTITIAEPDSGFTSTSQVVEITGTVKNVTEIALDGQPIPINESGKFTKKLILAPGVNMFTFISKDKFGRERSELLEVFYQINKEQNVME